MIVRCVNANKHAIVEGEIRAKELAEYLDSMKCTKKIWVSEDDEEMDQGSGSLNGEARAQTIQVLD